MRYEQLMHDMKEYDSAAELVQSIHPAQLSIALTKVEIAAEQEAEARANLLRRHALPHMMALRLIAIAKRYGPAMAQQELAALDSELLQETSAQLQVMEAEALAAAKKADGSAGQPS